MMCSVYKMEYVSLILWITAVTFTEANGCPAFWHRVGDQCFRLVSSLFIQEKLGRDSLGFPTAYHAQLTCKQYGGDLAHIRDSYYENQAYALLRSISEVLVVQKVYIGLTDIRREGHFEWMDQEPAAYTDWGPGEPSNGRGQSDEECVVVESRDMAWLAPNTTEWHDYPCCSQTYITHALCSRDLQESAAHERASAVNTEVLRDLCNTVDECVSNPCLQGATCLDDVMGYTCVCPFGFRGTHCETEILCPLWGLREATPGTVYDGDPAEPPALDSTLSVSCVPGYSFHESGNPVLKRYNCTDGGWVLVHRIEVECPPIRTWAGIRPDHRDRHYGSILNYTCAEGLGFNDTELYKTATCSFAGDWEPPMDECIELEDDGEGRREPEPVEASGAAVLGSFGLIFLVCELCAFVLLDVNVYRRQVLLGFRNVRSLVRYYRHGRRRRGFQAVPDRS